MARTFEINKKDGTNVVPAGASPETITGIAAGTAVKDGDYVAVAIEDGKKATPTPIPAFTVKTVAVSGITADPTTVSIAVGATSKPTIAIQPTNATNKKWSATSADATIATVVADGTITGVKAGGPVDIEYKTEDGSKVVKVATTVTSE